MHGLSYQFKLGGFRCAALRDGALNYPPATFAAGVETAQIAEVLREHDLPDDRIETPYTCLYVDTGRHKVMVDLGAGAIGAQAAHIFPGLDHTTSQTGLLLESLAELRVLPQDIDTVIITHAHPDHVAGALDGDGAPVFRAARYVIGHAEWDYWWSDEAAASKPSVNAAVARRSLAPLRDLVAFVEDGDEVVPGVRVVATPGHTPGHLAVACESQGAALLHISDAALHPLLIERPTWRPVFDIDPGRAEASMRLVCERAASSGALVFAHHFPPFPSLGRIGSAGDAWRWEPKRP